MSPPEGGGLFTRFLSGLRFPQLFVLLALLFILDFFWPDPLPLVDEAILGLLTLMMSQWKKAPKAAKKTVHRSTGDFDRPPEKNITPQD